MNKKEILDMIDKFRDRHKNKFREGEYKDGFLDGLGLLWIDLNYNIVRLE